MKSNLKYVVAILCFMLLHASLFGQRNEWKIEKSQDGKITVKHKFSKRIGVTGKEEQVVEYIATTTTDVSLNKLISIVKDPSQHKEFMSQKTSTKVKTLSDNEWIVYYFYEGFWPYPSSDIVAKMICNEDGAKKVATFTLTAAPALVEDKGVRRLDYYYLTYLFKDIGNGNAEISVMSRFTPAVKMPAFMMNTWFPDGPADYIKGMIRLANKVQ